MKLTTLCYVLRGDEVLLAMKKRGFGAGKWNGPGGKVLAGEAVEDAMRREMREETGMEIGGLEDRGAIEFVYKGRPESTTRCSVFVSRDFSGDPMETEEMRPAWFSVDAIPYAEMWESDPLWFPSLLAGERVACRLYFNEAFVLTHAEPLEL